MTILELAQRVIDHTGSSSEIELVPYADAYAKGFEDMQRRVPNTRKIEALMGWRPVRTLDNILRDATADARRELRLGDDSSLTVDVTDDLESLSAVGGDQYRR